MVDGPLRGLRVLEIAGRGPGQFCTMLLADLGADVVRVDRASPGLRVVAPEFELLNRGKRSILLDLKEARDVETALALTKRSHVLVECFRPGVAERLGIGPNACLQRNPQLVYGRATGWGQHGPLSQSAGHDLDYVALSSALHALGSADGPPQVPLTLIGDFPGGLYLAVGLLSALYESRHSGRGQVIDAAVVDGTAHMMTMLFGFLAAGEWQDKRGVNLIDGGAPFYNVYETADGKYMAVGAMEETFFKEMTTYLGIDVEENYLDRATWPALRRQMSDAFRSRTQEEWVGIFDGTDACVAPVVGLREATRHPHLSVRNTFVEIDGVMQPNSAPRFSRTPASVRRGPSNPGEHTEEILGDWLSS